MHRNKCELLTIISPTVMAAGERSVLLVFLMAAEAFRRTVIICVLSTE